MRKKIGIREAVLVSGLLAGQAIAQDRFQPKLNPAEILKMQELQLNPIEMTFLKDYIVLVKKYPELKGKFGLSRLHDHFDLEDNEVLHETTDELTQVSVTRKIHRDELPNDAVPALFDDGGGNLMSVGVRNWCCD